MDGGTEMTASDNHAASYIELRLDPKELMAKMNQILQVIDGTRIPLAVSACLMVIHACYRRGVPAANPAVDATFIRDASEWLGIYFMDSGKAS